MPFLNKLNLWDINSSNLVTSDELKSDIYTQNGFKKGDYLKSQLFNTLLREITLVTTALIESIQKHNTSADFTVDVDTNQSELADKIYDVLTSNTITRDSLLLYLGNTEIVTFDGSTEQALTFDNELFIVNNTNKKLGVVNSYFGNKVFLCDSAGTTKIIDLSEYGTIPENNFNMIIKFTTYGTATPQYLELYLGRGAEPFSICIKNKPLNTIFPNKRDDFWNNNDIIEFNINPTTGKANIIKNISTSMSYMNIDDSMVDTGEDEYLYYLDRLGNQSWEDITTITVGNATNAVNATNATNSSLSTEYQKYTLSSTTDSVELPEGIYLIQSEIHLNNKYYVYTDIMSFYGPNTDSDVFYYGTVHTLYVESAERWYTIQLIGSQNIVEDKVYVAIKFVETATAAARPDGNDLSYTADTLINSVIKYKLLK